MLWLERPTPGLPTVGFGQWGEGGAAGAALTAMWRLRWGDHSEDMYLRLGTYRFRASDVTRHCSPAPS